MSSPHREAVRAFSGDLRKLRTQVGGPSLSRLVSFADDKYQKSTFSAHLGGKRAVLPTWEFVITFVKACRAYAEATDQSTLALGSNEEWRARYLAARFGMSDAPSPTRSGKEALALAASEDMTTALTRTQLQEAVGEVLDEHNSLFSPTEPGEFRSRITLPFVEDEDIPQLDSIPARTALLVVLNGINAGKKFVVERDLTTIGRDHTSDVFIPDFSISKFHAEIHVLQQGFTLRDLGSKNGTYVNRVRLANEHFVRLGDQLHFGQVRMIFLARPDPESSGALLLPPSDAPAGRHRTRSAKSGPTT